MAQTVFPLQEYKETERLNPFWSSFVCFCETIKNRKHLRRPNITKYFNQLVEKGDYSKSDKSEVLGYLFGLARGKEGNL